MGAENGTISPSKRFWRLLRPDQKEVTNIYVYAIFNGLVNLSLPLGIQAIIGLIQGGQISASWVVLVIIVIAGVAATGILQIYQLRITENLQQKIFTRAAFEFAFRLPRVKMEALYDKYAPELMNRFFDTLSIQKGLSKILIDFSTATLQVIFGLILLSFYHPFFIAFSLLQVFLVYAIFRYTGQKGLSTSLQESKYKYKVAHWLQELARTNTTFKLAGNTKLPLDRTNEHAGDYIGARESHFKVLVQQYSLMVIFKILVAAGLLIMGGLLVMEQQMNIGQFVAAEIIILLVINSVEKLITSMETIYDVLTSLEKVGQVTDMELEHSAGIDITQSDDTGGLSVTLDDIHFAYPDHIHKTINGVSLEVKAGERLFISGTRESGKTTLLNLIAGLFEVQQGTISYGGLAKGNLNLTALRSVIGDCLTNEMVFQGTVMENISMGREGATFENVRWAVQNLGFEDFIKQLPKGYDTMLHPEGRQLPKSIVQKLILARSIADKPRLLLLKDALQHLDRADRKKIITFLTQPEHKWTLITVSADIEFAKPCDRILLMNDGKIEHQGNFEDLRDKLQTKNQSNA